MTRGRQSTGRLKPCQHCGKVFWCTPSIDVGGTMPEKKFCSDPCGWAYRMRPEVVEARFWSRVDKSAGSDACWPWRGAITSHGYGCTAISGTDGRKVVGAHKQAFLYDGGEVQPGQQVMHSCDNPPCCNPKHLSAGTRQDNADDRTRKGRGIGKHKRKLTAEIVREIRRLRGIEPSGTVAKKFDITQPYVIVLWNNRAWVNA